LYWSVVASFRTAGVSCCWIVVITILSTFANFSGFTLSSLRIASCDEPSRARTLGWSVSARSSLEIARISCANVAIVTVLLGELAVSVFAASGGTFVRRNANRSVDTSDVLDEGISSAEIVIVTVWNDELALVVVRTTFVSGSTSVRWADDWLVDTSSLWAAVSSVARWSRSTLDWLLDDSLLCVTFVDDTFVWFASSNQLS